MEGVVVSFGFLASLVIAGFAAWGVQVAVEKAVGESGGVSGVVSFALTMTAFITVFVILLAGVHVLVGGKLCEFAPRIFGQC